MFPDDRNNDDLSRGLEAAFSPDDEVNPQAVEGTLSVVKQLGQKLGTTTQFKLSAEGEESPIAKRSVDEVGTPLANRRAL